VVIGSLVFCSVAWFYARFFYKAPIPYHHFNVGQSYDSLYAAQEGRFMIGINAAEIRCIGRVGDKATFQVIDETGEIDVFITNIRWIRHYQHLRDDK
jgi:hypothetical protein